MLKLVEGFQAVWYTVLSKFWSDTVRSVAYSSMWTSWGGGGVGVGVHGVGGGGPWNVRDGEPM